MRIASPIPKLATRVVMLDEVDSTNAEVSRRMSAGERDPLWVVAERQTAGRGRSGRDWRSPPGNLYASRLLPVSAAPRLLPQLSFVAGVALHCAIERGAPSTVPAGLRLKWPNDVLLDGAKLAGILIESTTIGAHTFAVIGLGVNIIAAPPTLERPATALADHGATCGHMALLGQLDTTLDHWIDVWGDGHDFAAIRTAWLARATPRGSPIRVHLGSTPLDGFFDGIDEDGALSVTDHDGKSTRVTFGDVDLIADARPLAPD